MNITVISHKAEVMAAVKAASQRALEICGGKMETYAKASCPVKTGNLRGSITHTASSEEAVVGTGVSYAPYVEFGHAQQPGRYVPALGKRLVASHVAGKPFLGPALENHVGEYRAVIEAELSSI